MGTFRDLAEQAAMWKTSLYFLQRSSLVQLLALSFLGRNTTRASTEALLSLGWQSWAPALSHTGEAVISLSTNRATDITPGTAAGGLTTHRRQHILCQRADSFKWTVPLPWHSLVACKIFTYRGTGTGSALAFLLHGGITGGGAVCAKCGLLTMMKRPSDG